jgi:group I intron endonuclease
MDVKLTGHIYLISNTISQKKYVGQTASHRKNRGQYKPFGFEGRFRDHLSEAICNTKKKQCRYLNNAIRLYGKDVFQVTLLAECSLDELDTMEQKYIETENTLYPNGYNLTRGGKGAMAVKTEGDVEALQTNTPRKRGGCTDRSAETRSKISQQLKKSMDNDPYRNDLMKRAHIQHYSQKIKRFEGISIDTTNLDQYIFERKDSILVKINNIRTAFVGKFETKGNLRVRAKEFLKQIATTAMLPNCSGNP